jgi:glycopeptide antibiotics resistance protein
MSRRRVYLLVAVALFALEVLIATELKHFRFVRYSLGDVLVTMLLYCLALALRDFERWRLAAIGFGFACSIEVAQYLQLAQRLGLAKGSALRIAIGDAFEWTDIACYFAGSVLAFTVDGLSLSKSGIFAWRGRITERMLREHR